MGIRAYQDNHGVALGDGISCLFLPSVIWICLVERKIANTMLSKFLVLFVKVILEIEVFVELKAHKYVQNSHNSPERKILGGFSQSSLADFRTVNIISAGA